MTEPASSYIARHQLVLKYGLGIVLAAVAGIMGAVQGDPGNLIALKILMAVPFAIAWIALPMIFNPERSRLPMTPSFIERTLLEGLLLIVWVMLVLWSPDQHPAALFIGTGVGLAAYFGLQLLMARLGRK